MNNNDKPTIRYFDDFPFMGGFCRNRESCRLRPNRGGENDADAVHRG